MTASASDIVILKRTCYGEARDQGAAGIQAQAWSMVNRHAAGKWYSGATYAEMCLLAVVAQEPQFDCWLSRDRKRQPIADWVATVTCPDDDPLMMQCEAAVMAALDGTAPDPTHGATHYYDDSIPRPSWAAPPATFCVAIGALRFWKGVN
jgi:N-acetylmuramoyl-L-alanine amidase